MALNGQLYSTQKRTMSGVKRTVKDYSESTTIHGISYIFESGLSALERFLWICVVCVFFGFAVGLSVQAYINWKENQVLMKKTMNIMPEPPSNMQRPSNPTLNPTPNPTPSPTLNPTLNPTPKPPQPCRGCI